MDLIQKIFEAGVVGAGGAGFPTHKKLSGKIEYLIVNGAECEPLLETDKYLMRSKSLEIIKAMDEVGKKIGAKKFVLGLKRKYDSEIIKLEAEIKKSKSKVKLFLLDNFYPAGDEQILVYEVTKRAIPGGGIPLDVGAVVLNVGTMTNIYDALSDKPVIDKVITIIGEIRNPGLYKVPIGISIKSCIEGAGGTSVKDYSVIMGGPMMGRVIHVDEIEEEVITKTIGSLIIIRKDHYIVQRKEKSIKHMVNQAKSTCIQCSMCTDLCPRFLIGHQLRPHKIMRTLGFSDGNEEVIKEALICCECGVCELYACPMGLSPRTINAYLKEQLRKQGVKVEKQKENTVANQMREYRKIPVKRLIARLNLTKYTDIIIADPIEISAYMVRIPLKQHIGNKAVPKVCVGDKVFSGQLISEIEKDSLGANIHSSIDGVVREVSDSIIISRE